MMGLLKEQYNRDRLNRQLRLQRLWFKLYCGVSASDFEFVLNLIGAKISQKITDENLNTTAQDSLIITLKFLTTGDSCSDLTRQFNVSEVLISSILPAVCVAICGDLREYVKIGTNADDWIKIAEEFESKWEFPHCIGVLDCKLIALQHPANSEPGEDNSKHTSYILLLGIVDANYRFIYTYAAGYKVIPDGNVFHRTNFYSALYNGTLDLPSKTPLKEMQKPMPYVLVADNAFAMSENVMKYYSGYNKKGSKKKIFNDRLGRVRRVAAKAFGILSSKFPILRKPLPLAPEVASVVVSTCVVLHDFLSTRSPENYFSMSMLDREENGSIINGTNEISNFLPLKCVGGKCTIVATDVRNEFADFFFTNVSIPGQENI